MKIGEKLWKMVFTVKFSVKFWFGSKSWKIFNRTFERCSYVKNTNGK